MDDLSGSAAPSGARKAGRDLRAVVTGATGGVGTAVARELAGEGVSLALCGRRSEALAELAEELRGGGAQVRTISADLRSDGELEDAASAIRETGDELDLLVHAAGVFARGRVADLPLATFDELFRVNHRARFYLTRELLPLLKESRGQVVFVNSSLGLRGGAGVGAYAGTMHANRALADSVRDEVNEQGVRVLTVYLGRTATEMQEEVHALEGRPYDPDRLIRPETVARTILHAATLPRDAEITDLTLRPMRTPPPPGPEGGGD